MKKLLLLFAIIAFAWFGTVIADREKLNGGLIGVQVLVDADDMRALKLNHEVRDAVTTYLNSEMTDTREQGNVRKYLMNNLTGIDNVTKSLIKQYGLNKTAKVSLMQRSFRANQCGSYTIPSGVYDTIRIVIGNGEGKNVSDAAFADLSDYAGFSNELKTAISGSGEWLRFHILNALGMIESFLFSL